jgi:biofilm PGA synthesis lipoprotein PgaB
VRHLAALLLLFGVWCSAHAQSPDVIVLCYHDVRDNVGGKAIVPSGSGTAIFSDGSGLDPDQYAISTRNLVSHFDWLQTHGYHVISLQQFIEARTHGAKLPDHAVLLTFDDGLRSAYTKVFPLLEAYHFPAVMAIVGAWTDLPKDGKVDFGPRVFTRDDFATWQQLREMQNSGLVEIASHSYEQHEGILANPQGNLIPAILVHAYNVKTGRYETDDEYSARIRADLKRSSTEIQAKLGHAPRAIIWPYGAYTQIADSIADSLGMKMSFTLAWPVTFPSRPFGLTGTHAVPRLILMSNPSVGDMVWSLHHLELHSSIRAVQVDLDYIYDPDPVQQERNLGKLLDRIKALNVTQVWLQAFADPGGTGAASSVYFPNGELPMRADLFSRVAWQLRTRAGVKVYAWMPVLAWQLPDKAMQARLQIQPKRGVTPETPLRLNPFLPETKQIVGSLYEDLGRAAPLDGILFSDDAFLRDTDDLGPDGPAPGAERTRDLIDFTIELSRHVQHWSPELRTVRNLFAEPVLHPAAEAWYAQSLPAFLSSYDWVALMAMPEMENAKKPNPWLTSLERHVASVPGGIQKTIFELQAVDWRTREPIDTGVLAQQMRTLLDEGALHLAYYPDDPAKGQPDIHRLMPAFSTAVYPAPQN